MNSKVLLTMACAAMCSACSTISYGTNGVSAFVPTDSNPQRYSNIYVSKVDYKPEDSAPSAISEEETVVVVSPAATSPRETLAATSPRETLPPDPAPSNKVVGSLTIYADSTYGFKLHPGPLKYQLTELLKHHEAVETVVWEARDNHLWAGDFEVKGTSIEEIANKVAVDYSLGIDIHKNNIAVVGEFVK